MSAVTNSPQLILINSHTALLRNYVKAEKGKSFVLYWRVWYICLFLQGCIVSYFWWITCFTPVCIGVLSPMPDLNMRWQRFQYELCARLLLFSSLNNLMEYLCSIFYHFACPEKPCEEQSQRSFRVFSTFFTAVLFILILLLLQTFDKWNSQTSKAPCVLHSFLEVHLDSIIS